MLHDLWKRFAGPGGPRVVARGVSAVFPGGSATALFGPNGAGKSTLLAMIAGTMRADAGRVERRGRVSWPVGFQGGFHPDMTGAQNTRFVARLYGAESGGLLGFVEEVAGLGAQMRLPVRHYSNGMRARLGFALSMGLPFDMYLVDEVTAVGDAAFRAQSAALLRARLGRGPGSGPGRGSGQLPGSCPGQAGAIVVSHAPAALRGICDRGAVLRDGRLTMYEDLEEAIAMYREVV